MSGGIWDPTALPVRPGLYMNFKNAALANITGGARGIVALPVFSYTGGTAVAGKFYTIEGETDAISTFGAANIVAIKRVLEGGAKEVLAFAVPPLQVPEETTVQYSTIRDAYEAETFNVFVYPTVVPEAELTSTKSWVARNRDEGKHFLYIAGGTAEEDADIELGNARSVILKDEYVVNLVSGVILPDDTEVQSADFAPYIGGLIAATAINKSITYTEVPVADVTKRLTNSQIKSALVAGSLVLIKDGNVVRIEQGITTDSDETKRGKIRIVRGKQAIATDIPATARANYIGKVDNNPAGQAALISAVKRYMQTMENNNVLMNPTVVLSKETPSEGDSVFLDIAYTEVDSMERILITVTT